MKKVLARDFCNLIKIKEYNESKWFSLAYSTMQRTKKGGISIIQKKYLQDYLFTRINNLKIEKINNKTEFEIWIFECINELMIKGDISFGQSQKIINIILKYFYSFYYSELDKNFNESHLFINDLAKYFHAPIDNIILVKLKKEFDKENLLKSLHTNNNVARFYIEGNYIPWSKLENKLSHVIEYIKIQYHIENCIIESNCDDKLHFEMKSLWSR